MQTIMDVSDNIPSSPVKSILEAVAQVHPLLQVVPWVKADLEEAHTLVCPGDILDERKISFYLGERVLAAFFRGRSIQKEHSYGFKRIRGLGDAGPRFTHETGIDRAMALVRDPTHVVTTRYSGVEVRSLRDNRRYVFPPPDTRAVDIGTTLILRTGEDGVKAQYDGMPIRHPASCVGDGCLTWRVRVNIPEDAVASVYFQDLS